LKTIFVTAGVPQKSNVATFLGESHTIFFHPRGSTTRFVSIPTGIPQH